jgi:NAD(P)-dependent dehydrogenase (short-subunit alcohol dehydrogenase family)/acyl carrier protein
MLGVVSELTGYPEEMISFDMDIEADLGIDSIKRVEILSAFEERMPDLPQVSPEMLGTMKTLGQIVAYLVGAAPSVDAAPPAARETAAEPAPVQDSSAPAPVAEKPVAATLVGVVSELTGYPEEMISLDMDIEADLGIDSIKRVEILSAFEERMPDLPPVSPEEVGSLRTLGQIVEALAVSGPGAASPAGQPAAVEVPLAAAAGIGSTLVAVVSELTGYPEEMISMDMDIEADLGIDSIKRVEILSAFEERMPGLPPVPPEEVGSLKTLGQIVAHLEGGAVAPGAAAPAEPMESIAGPDAPDENSTAGPVDAAFVEKKKVLPVPSPFEAGPRIAVPDGRPVFIAEDAHGLGRAIAAALETRGIAAIAAPPAELLEWQDVYTAAGLVILADAWENRDADFLPSAFALLHRLGTDLVDSGRKGGALFSTVSRIDGAFGFQGGGLDEPYQGGLAGLAKTAALEWPEVCCHALDIAPGWEEVEAVAEAIVRELVQAGPVEVGLDREERRELSLAPAAYPEGGLNLAPGDVVVATGGARGVTAECLCALAGRAPLTLVLLGRSPAPTPEPEWLSSLTSAADMKRALLAHHPWPDGTPTPAQLEAVYQGYANGREIAGSIQRMMDAGATVHYATADVRDAEAVGRVLDEVRAEHGPVKALIHGAGILEDRFIVDKTPDQFARVLETKVRGLEVLLEALESDPLAYLILFSSVAARMGNRGQADYAAANEVLNKIAQKTAALRPSCRVISFNWGPWDGGMVSPELRREFERSGVALIPLSAGAESMVAEMAGLPGESVEIVMGGGLAPQAPSSPDDGRKETASLPDAAPEVPHAPPAAAEIPGASPQDLLCLLFKREVDIERFPVIGSSLLDGQPVFPFALMTEWLGHGALHDNPGLYLHGLDDVRLVRRIQVGAGRKLIRLMAGKARRNGGIYEVDVELRNGVQGTDEVVHSRARAILADTPHQAPPSFSPPLDIRVKSYAKSMDEIYEKILFLGEDLRGIREIMRCSPKGIIAKITSAPPPERWMAEPLRTRWIGDPLVLDSAFQMVTVWAHDQKGRLSLPNYGAAYRQYRPAFPENGVTAVFEVTGADDDSVKGDFTFLDAGNEVVAQLLGYEAVLVPQDGAS